MPEVEPGLLPALGLASGVGPALGLAIGPVAINAATYMLFSYIAGHATPSVPSGRPRLM